MEAAPKDPYDHVARIYDAISQLYSLGQIRACKRWQCMPSPPATGCSRPGWATARTRPWPPGTGPG